MWKVYWPESKSFVGRYLYNTTLWRTKSLRLNKKREEHYAMLKNKIIEIILYTKSVCMKNSSFITINETSCIDKNDYSIENSLLVIRTKLATSILSSQNMAKHLEQMHLVPA